MLCSIANTRPNIYNLSTSGPRYYQSLVQSPEMSPSDKQISLDLHRSFPRNVYFNSDNGTKVPPLFSRTPAIFWLQFIQIKT